MKKYLALFLALMLALAVFAACGKEKDPQQDTDQPSQGDTPVTPGKPEDKPASAKVKVTLDADDGADPTVTELDKGASFDKPADPSRKGFTFDGWFVADAAASFPMTVNEDVTVKAKWTAEPAEVPTLNVQPAETAVVFGTRAGPSVEVKQTRGYVYTYAWYYNTTDSAENGTLIEGATEASCLIPTSLKVGQVVYVYCVVTGTRTATNQSASVTSATAKVTIEKGTLNALVVGSGLIKNANTNTVDFLQALVNASGTEMTVDSLTKGNNWNIWEGDFTGAEQSNIIDMMKLKNYSFIVLQMGRDYVLTTESTAEKEMVALKNICNKAQELNPGAVIILEVCPWRQDTSSNYWKRYFDGGIENPEDHKVAITNYMNGLVENCGYPVVLANVLGGFEKALEAGINPFFDEVNDFCSVEGSYLSACIFYAKAFGKSPVGLDATKGGDYSVDAAVAKKLQQIAADVALAQ